MASIDGEPLKNEDLPAAFWDALPEKESEHPDLLAINALLEESTADERAETLKNQGNDALKKGRQARNRFYLREAVGLYNKALALKPDSQQLRAALHSNLALAHLTLSNARSALAAALAALQADPENVKACHRGARAALALGDTQHAKRLCKAGLAIEPGAPELQQLLDTAQDKEQAQAAELGKAEAAALAARKPAEQLAAAMRERGLQIGHPQFRPGPRKPYLDQAGALHWPLLFVLAEAMQLDVVEDASENDTLAAHLDAMFGPGAPPLAWDAEGVYMRDRVQAYYLAHAAQPLGFEEVVEVLHGGWPETAKAEPPQRYGSHAARWVHAPEEHTIGEIVSASDFVVTGVPTFFIIPGGTQYADRFLAGESGAGL